MFWGSNDFKAENDKLKDEIDDLKSYLENLRTSNDERVATVIFDFKTINVFSIERNQDNGVYYTVIGYLLPTEIVKDNIITLVDEVKEWNLYCSLEQHEQLVQEYLKSKQLND